MLIQRTDDMMPSLSAVKKTSRYLLTALVLCMAAIALRAFAKDGPLVDREVTVKFRMSDFRAENGTKTVYAKPTRKAKSSCKSDPLALDYLDQTVDECAADLVEQLIRSAELEQLTAYRPGRRRLRARPLRPDRYSALMISSTIFLASDSSIMVLSR